MFTGLVEALGTVAELRREGAGQRLAVAAPEIIDGMQIGDSVAINGCCLTVVSLVADRGRAEFEAGPETLRKTNLGTLQVGDRVNLERALLPTTRLGGHLMQGHVDGVGTIRERSRQGEWETVWFHAGELARQMVPKGSVAVDGISLTVVDVTEDQFSVALIPHTLAVTTLGWKRAGSVVNLETDILGKYVLKFLGQIGGGLTLEKLKQAGFVS
jgi:riboflavin synthase